MSEKDREASETPQKEFLTMSTVLNNRGGYWDPQRFPLVAAYQMLPNDTERRRFLTALRRPCNEEAKRMEYPKAKRREPRRKRPSQQALTFVIWGTIIAAAVAVATAIPHWHVLFSK